MFTEPARRYQLVLSRALAMLGAAVALLAVAIGIYLHFHNLGGVATFGVTDWWLMPMVAAVTFAASGALLVWCKPGLSIGWLALAGGATNGVMSACLEYGVWALPRTPHRPWDVLALWVGNWLWVTSLLLIASVIPLLLPNGRLISRSWRPALALSIVAVVSSSASWALTPYASWSPVLADAGAVNPFAVDWVWNLAVQLPLNLLAAAAVVVAHASIYARWRQATGTLRRQMQWILLGAVVELLLWLAGLLVSPTFTALAMIPMPAVCLIAVRRYQLWNVDLIVSRSLRYGGLAAAVAALYAASLWLSGVLLGRATGAPLVATAVVAVCAEPLHRHLRSAANRLVYGRPEDPFEVLNRAGQRLEGARDSSSVHEEVLPEVVAAVAAALQLPYVAIALDDGPTVACGQEGDPVEQVPLIYGGRRVGTLLFEPRPGGVSRADRELLRAFARHAAVAAHTLVLTRDLAWSRDELITAREAERRRLYRDLHDGLGPSLAALALQVETARDLASSDPEMTKVLLDRATPRLKSAVDEVRSLVRGLHPPALNKLGLAKALRELGGSFCSPGFTVAVEVDDLSPLPAALEVAAFRIAAEALTNASRHSGGAHARVRVHQRDGTVEVAVHDDGVGCPRELDGDGLGVPSMHARARELGGTFVIHSRSGGGTSVTATLPVRSS